VALPLKLDEIVGAGKFALAEGARAVSLHKPSAFETSSQLERRDLYRSSALKAGSTELAVSAGDIYLERLKIMRATLGAKIDSAELKSSLIEAKKQIDQTLKENLTAILSGQRRIEQAWRELDAFIKLARKADGTAVPLRVANVSVDALCEDDAKFQQLSNEI